nr:DUF4129 domain-containing protein [Anaerolineae bacterium]
MAANRKLIAGALLGGVLVTLVVLASGLSDFKIVRSSFEPRPLAAPVSAGGADLILFEILLNILFWFFMISIPIGIVLLIISKDARKTFARNIIFMLIAVGILLLAMSGSNELIEEEEETEEPVDPEIVPSVNLPVSPTSETDPVDPPRWVVWALSVGVVVITASGILWLVTGQRSEEESDLEMLAAEAQTAIDDILAGGDVKDAILRCYYDMIRTLRETQRIKRDAGMTPREFEQRLIEAGLPAPHVERLTRLFEMVRYGLHTPDRVQEEEAISCLTAIVDYARIL